MAMSIAVGIAIALVVLLFLKKVKKDRQRRFLEHYTFAPSLLKRVQKQHDYLSDEDMLQVARATKDYFIICHMAQGKMVAMPSEIVDVLWHEFILFTREYEQFCKQGLGRFLHHIPTEAMKSETQAQEGIKRAWRLACARSDIDPKKPTRLPLLFRIDKVLNIVGGFKYVLDCSDRPFHGKNNKANVIGCGGYCATHINCSSGCSGVSGGGSGGWFGGDGDGSDAFDSHSCGSGCGSGCGGGGT